MNWKLIGALSGFGVLMGVASVLGFTKGLEGLLWLVIAGVCVWLVVGRVPGRWFLHGFYVGLVGGAVAPILQVLFFSTYMANNPDLATKFAEIPGGMEPRMFFLVLTPGIALVSGLVLGLLCWLVAKLARKSRAAV
jgi:uncharacterized membrane protein YvlD (DUF360 family)